MAEGDMHFTAASDRALLIQLGEGISVEVNARAHRLAHRLETLAGVTSLSPAYASLLVRFDPLQLTHSQVEQQAREFEEEAPEEESGDVIEIPVRYGGADGPDLEELANRHSLTPAHVIELHSRTIYHAYFAGFVPGFVYLGEVPTEIATPRRSSPRREVPPGSVGIAGTQTGVYPRPTPGGWNLIGRTDAVLFDVAAGKAMIEPGHKARFVPL